MNHFQRIENKNEWLELLKRALFKTFFHNLEWENFLEKQFKWLKFEHYLYKDEAILCLARCKIFGKEKLISHPFCEYGGPLPLKNEIEGMEFKRELFLNFKIPFKLSFHPQISKYFKNFGFKKPDSQRDTYFIEGIHQRSEDEIFSSFRKTLRHLIKKAESQNLEIKQCQDKKELSSFYGLYIRSVRKHKNIPYPFSFFEYFRNNKDSEIILAKIKDRVAAGSIFLFYNGFVHYFLNASDKSFKNSGVNHLILWTQIKKYRGKVHQVFDLGGTRRGSSLEVFKQGWGSIKYPIFELKNYQEKFKESNLRNILPIFTSFLMKRFNSYFLKYKL